VCALDWNVANFLVQLAVAIGTVGAVVLVLFLEFFKKPKLEIDFEQKEPYCRKTRFLMGAYGAAFSRYWIRIKVANKGRTVAKNCEAKLVDITEIRDNETVHFQPFDPVILRWASYPEETDLRPTDINKQEYEYLNVIYTVESGESRIQKDAEGQAKICTDARGRGIIDFLPVGKYILTVTIYGENVDPVSKKFRLIWEGKWDEIKMLEVRTEE